MGVANSHRDIRVTQDLLDRHQVDTVHNQVRSERVAKVVEAHMANARVPARCREGRNDRLEPLPRPLREDIWRVVPTETTELGSESRVHRDFPRAAVF